MALSDIILLNWQHLSELIAVRNSNAIIIDGLSLDLASIVASARYNKEVKISAECLSEVQKSASDVKSQLEAGATIYAINTGVGASANTRTDATEDLQRAIMETLNCGITTEFQISDDDEAICTTQQTANDFLPVQDVLITQSLPISWAKAAQLVRLNSLASGNSGIRKELLQNLTLLLQANIVPNMPLRGSISASGDLSPLSYLAGAIQGNPGIQVWVEHKGERLLTTADKALKDAGIVPTTFAPKEALAIVNGTSVSAAAAALAMHDAHGCMVLAQILTAMNVEGLNGTTESFDPYFSVVKPHPGQAEAAHNMRCFLTGSQLVRAPNTANVDGLQQDRYALRTSPQWLGPELENMLLAHHQIVTECNSVTDNPLVKKNGIVLQGGNFQASAVTSAMDKVRSALQTTGRMIFQQSSELMNPTMNNGLPPNLTADDPSCSFTFKCMDVASASYQSELALISHGMTPFMLSAELGNQSLNSMALVSTRYTHSALEIFMHLCANALMAVCQALDLRAIQHHFEMAMKPEFEESLHCVIHERIQEPKISSSLSARMWSQWRSELSQRMTLPLAERIRGSTNATIINATQYVEDCKIKEAVLLYTKLRNWSYFIEEKAMSLNSAVVQNHTTEKTLLLLGVASQKMYSFVRHDLKIPFIRKGSPAPRNIPTFYGTEFGVTIGTFITRIYDALKCGRLYSPIMQCLEEARANKQHEQSEQ